MDQTTGHIVTYVLGVQQRRLPAETVEECKRKLVDAIACALGGLPSQPATIARRLARRVQAQPAAPLFGCDGASAADWAAFANGVAIRQLDYNDTYPGIHPSDMLGGILSTAAAAGADGDAMLRAMAAGYEVVCGLMDPVSINGRGWDAATFIAIGSAAASGALLGLDREQLGHAVGIATVEAPALRATRSGALSMWKGCAGPSSARAGVYAALLAAEGMTGPSAPFDGKHGLFDNVTGPLDLALPDPAEGAPRMRQVHFKYFPCDFNTQAAVFAARQIRERFKIEEIDSLLVTSYHHAVSETAGGPERWDPRTRETADHSLPYILATALRYGDIRLEHFGDRYLLDPSLRPLMARIRAQDDPEMTRLFPREIVWQVEVATRAGDRETIRIVNSRGHPSNPMSREEQEAKLRRMAEGVLAEEHVDRLLAWLWTAEEAPNMDGLFDCLAHAMLRD